MEQSSITVSNVTKSYPGVYALKDVSFEVRVGEVHGVVGENGAGKSTLMGVISGSVTQDSGLISVFGDLLEPGKPEESRNRGIAIVRQEPALLPDLTVAENCYLGMPLALRPDPRKIAGWAAKMLKTWGGDFTVPPDARVEELPPEHRFIVEITRAIASRPRVLILDEPTEHLAQEDVVRLFQSIRDLSTNGTSVIYISHRVGEVRAIADRITVLRNGEIRATRDTSTLSESDIVTLIVGRALDATFPPKPQLDRSADPRLRVTNLTGRRFSSISMTVQPGEIVGIAGIEGNGQRELLRALGGLDSFTGTVSVDSRNRKYKNVGQAGALGLTYVASDRHREGVLAGLSVRENIALRNLSQFTRAGFVSSRREQGSVKTLAEQFRVKTPDLAAPVETLSGGNQQKAVLAGAFGSDPAVLLLDEPTQGVDVGARSEIYSLIRERAQATGMGVVVHSTDAKELAGIADRVLVMSRGRVVAELDGPDVTEEQITGDALRSTATRERVNATVRPFVRWLAGDIAPVAIVGVVVVLLTAITQGTNSYFLDAASITNILALAATLSFAALAQSVVLLVGGVDLSVGPLMGLLVVTSSFFLVDGTSPGLQALGWALFLLIPLAVGTINWMLIDLVGLHPMIATLVAFIGLPAVSLILRPTAAGTISSSLTSGISTTLGPIPLAFIVAVVMGLALTFWLFRSRAGIVLRAVGSSDGVAKVNALRPRLARYLAYVGASLIAAVGAITLMAQIGSGDPTGGIDYTLSGISAAVIGGLALGGARGSFIGAIVGALLIEVASATTTFLGLTSATQDFLVGGLTLLAVAGYSSIRSTTNRLGAS
jgi:ribose transport system ATP-binding protein